MSRDVVPSQDAGLAALARLAAASGQPALRATLAEALLRAGATGAALAEARACLAAAPDHVPALRIAGEIHARQGEHEAAALALARAATLAPARPSLLVTLANSLIEIDRFDEAERVLTRAVALAPDCTAALANLASVLVRRGKLAEAELPCRAALLNDPDLVSAHQNMSAILAVADPAAARAHRDAAYRRQHVFTVAAPDPRHHVLVLAAADQANTPLRHLLDRRHTSITTWYVEYATENDLVPPHDAIVNAIGEPELAPILPPSAERWLQAEGARLINAPAKVARTRRECLPALLAGVAGCVVPEVASVADAPARAVMAARIGFPVLVRPRGTHGGLGLRLVTTPQHLAKLPEFPAILTKFHDFRAADGYWRKYRVIFVDRRPFPLHLAISPHWLVHHCTAGMEDDAARRAEEQRFLADWRAVLGEVAADAVTAIGQRLDLDYAGLDFSLTGQGEVLVFEANAAMLVHPEPEPGIFAYRNAAVRRIQAAFAAMLGNVPKRETPARRNREAADAEP